MRSARRRHAPAQEHRQACLDECELAGPPDPMPRDPEAWLLYRAAVRNTRKSVQSWLMSWLSWRPRSLRDAAARLATWSATFAGGVYILERTTGWHPRHLDIALPLAGTLAANVV